MDVKSQVIEIIDEVFMEDVSDMMADEISEMFSSDRPLSTCSTPIFSCGVRATPGS